MLVSEDLEDIHVVYNESSDDYDPSIEDEPLYPYYNSVDPVS